MQQRLVDAVAWHCARRRALSWRTGCGRMRLPATLRLRYNHHGGRQAIGSHGGRRYKADPRASGQRIRNELIFSNTGGGYAPKAKYQLQIALRQSVTPQLVQITGNAQGEVLELNATFKLVDLANKQVIFTGATTSRAPFNRYQEIFANVRAQDNAQDRAAGEVAESIKTQVAAFLASST